MVVPFRRAVTVVTEPEPTGDGAHDQRTVARVDDWFHGFEIVLRHRDGVVTDAVASSHRHPWTTCPGALASVTTVSGPLAIASRPLVTLPRRRTCVHLNDLAWLATRAHRRRRYDLEVTPGRARLERDGEVVLDLPLRDWSVTGDGPYAGLYLPGEWWAERLADVGADEDLREAVRVLRRGGSVAMGYFTLDWATITRGDDIDARVMHDTCHTFSTEQVATAVCLARRPPAA